MKSISFVFQDVTLFNDTVYNNIRVGNMAATEEQVMAAAKAAYCDEFVMRFRMDTKPFSVKMEAPFLAESASVFRLPALF